MITQTAFRRTTRSEKAISSSRCNLASPGLRRLARWPCPTRRLRCCPARLSAACHCNRRTLLLPLGRLYRPMPVTSFRPTVAGASAYSQRAHPPRSQAACSASLCARAPTASPRRRAGEWRRPGLTPLVTPESRARRAVLRWLCPTRLVMILRRRCAPSPALHCGLQNWALRSAAL